MAERPPKDSLSDPELERRFMKFQDAHPELNEKLGLWMASASLLELQDPDTAAIFMAAFPELAG